MSGQAMVTEIGPKLLSFGDLRNASGLEFKDLTSEKSRTYYWPDGKSVLIFNPVALNVASSGSHRVLDGSGDSHYISPGWRHIIWTAKDDRPHFDF